MSKNRLIVFLAMSFAFILVHPYPAVTNTTPPAQTSSGTFFGEVKQVGNGVIWSWAIADAKGHPTSLGVTFTETALSGMIENLPSAGSHPTIEYELSLPKAIAVDPYTQIVVNWNPRGHIPNGIYDTPHFDFHFYMVPPGERYKITAKAEDIAKSNKKLPAQYVPAGYILPEGTQEPRMGAHWIHPGSPEFNKQPFTKTFIYGSYDGEMTFLEPMVAMAFFKEKSSVNEKITLPASYKKKGFYPTAYKVSYDPVRKEYSVSLEDLTFR